MLSLACELEVIWQSAMAQHDAIETIVVLK
jgi:hypothetical protein